MSESDENCGFCHKEKFKYKCPKCDTFYCSVTCYKSKEHLKCTEAFYKSCVEEEMAGRGKNSNADVRKMYQILERMRKFDGGMNPEDFDDFAKGLNDSLDSDDEQLIQSNDEDDEMEMKEAAEEEEDDLVDRLEGINLNNAEEVWQRLTPAEQKEFQCMIDCGSITRLVPDYKPWWHKQLESKIVDLSEKTTEKSKIPEIEENIPAFESIFNKSPSPCLHHNLWNILAAYACVVRFYNGEHFEVASEATTQLINLTTALKYGTNFEDAEDAIVSVEMEALTTGQGKPKGAIGIMATCLVESREQLQQDARQLMYTGQFKLAALSDIRRLLKTTKQELKSARYTKEKSELQPLFAMCNGSVELNSKKLQQLIKKIEFYLSYVQKTNVCNLE